MKNHGTHYMAWCVGNTIHLCHDSLVYQMLSAIHQTAESAGKGTTGTDEVTAFRTVPFLYGRWLDFRGTHGGLGNQYQAYHSLGENGILDSRRAELLKLPNRKPNKEEQDNE